MELAKNYLLQVGSHSLPIDWTHASAILDTYKYTPVHAARVDLTDDGFIKLRQVYQP